MKSEEIQKGNVRLKVYSMQSLVVGSGAAGLNAAVSLFKNGVQDTAILTEGKKMGTSLNTGSDKQTYYKLSTSGSDPDSVRKMAGVLFDGQSMDGDLALCEAAYSLRGFFHLVDIGVPFPCNGYGEYVGYKTDHDPNARGTSAGPLTSKFMTEALFGEAQRDNIPVFDGYQVIAVLTRQDGESPDSGRRRACGILALNLKELEPSKQFTVFIADNIVYAVGGEAGMYATSVYPASQTGGLGPAFRAGARGKNLTESQYGIASVKFRWNLSGTYQQVIPRYFSTDPDGNDPQEFLEPYFESRSALLNAIFLKGYQWPFDPRKTGNGGSSLIDLLVYQETVLKGRRVFLDYRHNPASLMRDGSCDLSVLGAEAYEYLQNSGGLAQTPVQRLEQMNPAAIELYRSHGIDLYRDDLEIAVCAQHNNGGLAGNCWWESNISHFFPVGEDNGTHGVYRPGGSALNSGQVGSLRAAQYIAGRYKDAPLSADSLFRLCGDAIEETIQQGLQHLGSGDKIFDYRGERNALGLRMSRYGANIRSEEGVRKALAENEAQQKALLTARIENGYDLGHFYRIQDLLLSQKIYLSAILDYIQAGGTSRGSYLIMDKNGEKPLGELPEMFRFSLEDRGFGKRIQEVSYEDGKVRFFWRDVRPVPEEDNWFEKVWKDYREGNYFK